MSPLSTMVIGVFCGVASLIAALSAIPLSLTALAIIGGFVFSISFLFLAVIKSVGWPRRCSPPEGRLCVVLAIGWYVDENKRQHTLLVLYCRKREAILYDLEEGKVVSPRSLKVGDLVVFEDGVLRKYCPEHPSPET